MRQQIQLSIPGQHLLQPSLQLVKHDHEVRRGLGTVLGAPPPLRVVEEVFRLVGLADLVERRVAV